MPELGESVEIGIVLPILATFYQEADERSGFYEPRKRLKRSDYRTAVAK